MRKVPIFLTLIMWLLVLGFSCGLPDASAQISSVIIVLDAGHGGRDPGAVVAGVYEKDINMAIVSRVFDLAKAHPLTKPVLTRATDEYVDLKERVRMAERVGASMYLSIQANACSYPSVHGAETWVDDTRPPTDPSWKLAETIQDSLVTATGAHDRGVRSQRLYTRHTTLPAALVEVGFLTCKEERRKLLEPEYQDKIAQGIFEGILEFVETSGRI